MRFPSSHNVDMRKEDVYCLDPREDRGCCCTLHRFGGMSSFARNSAAKCRPT